MGREWCRPECPGLPRGRERFPAGRHGAEHPGHLPQKDALNTEPRGDAANSLTELYFQGDFSIRIVNTFLDWVLDPTSYLRL